MADNTVLTSPNTEAMNQLKDPLVATVDKGEPPSEWASSTLTALGPAESKSGPAEATQLSNRDPATPSSTGGASSTATTPGVPVPGAYPRENHVGSSSISEDAHYVKDTAVHALETAKEYVVTTSEHVGAKVGEYLPESVASYLPPSMHPAHSDAKSLSSGPAETARNSDQVTVEGVPTSTHAPTSPESHSPGHNEPKSETMRESQPSTFLSTPSRGDGSGASEDASTHSLAGSRVHDRKSPNNVIECDSYSFTTAPNVAEFPQLNAELKKKPEQTSKSVNPPDHQDRPNIEHHAEETRCIPPVRVAAPDLPTETKWHAPDRSASGQAIPNVIARDYPVGSVDVKNFGFTHRDSGSSDVATPGHGDANVAAAAAASPALPPTPGMGESLKGKEKEKSVDRGKDEALTRAGDHAVTPSSGITAADLIQERATADPGASTSATDAPPPGLPARKTEAANQTATSTGNTSQKRTIHSEPAAGKPVVRSASQSKASSGNGTQKTKSGFMEKIKGEMMVLSGKLEHKQEKVDEGKRMMGKSASKN
ncbi:hypothetical protein CPB84DRAFT_1789676 [Gymnopilus junonius]|uniref:Uncharacterized protein n=1 Tax=Gymnopilus junonius TaxID=109634 RepID=A0A9P5NHI1_GYMJU|nr:hypothetical protein CPB84DRAFT_1789676 [Gymnopilus junonius]